MNYYQIYDSEDRYTYFLFVDTENKRFSAKREKGKHYRRGYITVDISGYLAAYDPIFANPLNYEFIENFL